MIDASVVDYLETLNVKGNVDSCLIDLSKLMLCDIPDYLDPDVPDKGDEDLEKEMDDIINDSFLNRPVDVDDFINPTNPTDDTKNPDTGDDGTETPITPTSGDDGTETTPDSSTPNKGDEDTDNLTDSSTITPTNGDNLSDTSTNDNDNIDSSTDKNITPTGSENEVTEESNHEPGTCECENVIIEFAADTVKYNHEPYIWNVKPGQAIDKDTIIAYCKQDGKILPVKSIFSQGVVRKDYTDGWFWRCWKTVTSRHIVIDGTKKCASSSSDGIDIEYLYNNPTVFNDVNVNLAQAGDALNTIALFYPYVLYLHLIYNCSNDQEDSTWDNDSLEETNNLPELVFNDFIKNKYIARRDKFSDDMCALMGGKDTPYNAIKATRGDAEQLRCLSNETLALKNQYFEDIVEMCQNYKKYFYSTSVYTHTDKREQWMFLRQMDFKLYPLQTENDTSSYKEINGAEVGQTIASYLSNLAKCIAVTDSGGLTGEFKDILNQAAKEFNTSKENQVNLRKWTKKVDELFDTCVKTYNTFKITEIPETDILDSDVDDYLSNTMKKVFKTKLAKWPEPKSYYYEITPEGFKEHYVFLNIDEINKKITKDKYEKFNGLGTKLGDEMQVETYKDDDNAYIGFKKGLSDGDSIYNLNKNKAKTNGSGSSDDGDSKSNTNPDDNTNPNNGNVNGSDTNPDNNTDSPNGDNGYGVPDDLDLDTVNLDPNTAADDLTKQLSDAAENAPTSYDGDVAADAAETPNIAASTQEDETDPGLTDLAYWVKYFGIATLTTMMFLATGIPLPYFTCIPLPCIYTPLVVVPITKVGLIMVIGIAIRGASVSVITLYVNMDSKENSMLIPITLSLATLKETFDSQIGKMNDLATNAANLQMTAVKLAQAETIKQKANKVAKLQALKNEETEGYKTIIDNFKKAAGEDVRNTLTRLKTSVDEKVSEAKEIADDAVVSAQESVETVTSSVSDVGGTIASLNISTGTSKKGVDDNSTVSPSIM